MNSLNLAARAGRRSADTWKTAFSACLLVAAPAPASGTT
jgi:hypothetical protein